ncbi:MAG: hydrogenase small subunit, partial [Coriobacteriales bacterium]
MGREEVAESGFYGYLAARKITRRQFLKFCGGIAVALGLTDAMAPRIAEALEIGATEGNLAPVIWLEAGSCSGCTESFAQVDSPDIATVVLDLISLNYSETLSAAAGYSLEQAKAETIAAGNYILVYEGGVMTGWDGNALLIGGEKGTDILAEAAASAVAVIACGSCAVDGGWQAGDPNPAGAMGVQQFLEERGISTPVVNLPACPVNPENVIAVIVDYLLIGQLPTLNSKNMPTDLFGQVIHDNCPRRGHFENGEFVYKFGSEEETHQFCLYAMGCRGPETYANCPVVRWNRRASWCVESGAPCCGCATANPHNNVGNWVNANSPFFSSRLRDLHIGDANVQPSSIALGITGIVAACIVVHAFGMKKTGRMGHGAEIETEKDYESKKYSKVKKNDGDTSLRRDVAIQKESAEKLEKDRKAEGCDSENEMGFGTKYYDETFPRLHKDDVDSDESGEKGG